MTYDLVLDCVLVVDAVLVMTCACCDSMVECDVLWWSCSVVGGRWCVLL